MPSRTETNSTVKKLKNGKAAGPNIIPTEVLKTDISITTDVMYGLFKAIWKKEELPTEWNEGLIVKLPKRGRLWSYHHAVCPEEVLNHLKMAVDE